jgi:hypothetical protein
VTSIFILHGTAERSPTYASDLVTNLPGLNVVQGFYGDLLDPYENVILDKLKSQPAWNKEHMNTDVRLPVMQFLQDMTFYINNQTIRDQIFNRIESQVPDEPYHLLLHSWGCMIGFDIMLKDILFDKAVSVTTIGCPLHLWGKSIRTDLPWSNFYHSEDILAAPLNSVFGCTDFEVTDAGPSTAIPGDLGLPFILSSHNCYWGSRQVSRHLQAI